MLKHETGELRAETGEPRAEKSSKIRNSPGVNCEKLVAREEKNDI
jgi:hypothetical protein